MCLLKMLKMSPMWPRQPLMPPCRPDELDVGEERPPALNRCEPREGGGALRADDDACLMSDVWTSCVLNLASCCR